MYRFINGFNESLVLLIVVSINKIKRFSFNYFFRVNRLKTTVNDESRATVLNVIFAYPLYEIFFSYKSV